MTKQESERLIRLEANFDNFKESVTGDIQEIKDDVKRLIDLHLNGSKKGKIVKWGIIVSIIALVISNLATWGWVLTNLGTFLQSVPK